MTSVVIFDSRLSTSPEGVVLAKTVIPKRPGDAKVDSDGSKSTDVVVTEAANAARRLALPVVLTIMCHGKAQNLMVKSGGAIIETVGGAGLDIGTPGLTENNIALVSQWRGLFTQIILLACAVAYKESKDSPFKTNFSGDRFCGQLAIQSGAEVIASPTFQKYDVVPATLWSILTKEVGEVDFGPWEGLVFSYDSRTGRSRLVNTPPQP